MSELNESVSHLAKSSKKLVRKCQQRLQRFSCDLISIDKDFILLLACFSLIFTRLLTLTSLQFFSLYPLLFSIALEQNLILSQESLLMFYIPS